MRLAINPTRMELLKLKKRLEVARRGHSLLKDKYDELMRNFNIQVSQIKDLREEVEEKLKQAYNLFLIARSVVPRGHMGEALMFPSLTPKLIVSTQRLFNFNVPVYQLELEGDFVAYGFTTTSIELDESLKKYQEVFPKMVELAWREKALEILADEIEKTRRRVNALEYILIPAIIETINFINFRLEELDRENLVRLMKVKEIVRSH